MSAASSVSKTPPSFEGAPSRQLRDYRWLIGVWVVVVLFAVVTAIWSRHVGVPLKDPDGVIFRRRLTSALVMLALLAVVDAAVRTGRAGWTPRKAAAMLRRRWPRERLVIAVTGLVAYHIVYVCYRNLKSWDAFNRPRDGDLLRLDRWLFFGHSPAVLLHDLLGQDLAAHVLSVIYASFTQLVPLAFVAALAFSNHIRHGYVMLTAGMWAWILGICSYYLIPTLGPFASAPQQFAHLTRTGVTSDQARYLAERSQLLEHPGGAQTFASISAFASLHVGYTCMVLLMLRYYGFRRAALVVGVYLVGVVIATIYFGWHFAVDDAAGILLAFLAVFLARSTIYPRGRPSTPSALGAHDEVGLPVKSSTPASGSDQRQHNESEQQHGQWQ